ASRGAKVTVSAPRPVIGAYIGATHLAETPLRLVQLGCTLLPNLDSVACRQGILELRHVVSGEPLLLRPDVVVVSAPPRPNLDLQGTLQSAGTPTYVVGDAHAPRTALHAFREGDRAGREI